MNAQVQWPESIRQQIIDNAKHHPFGEAHLEAEDIPQFALECGHKDAIASLGEALSERDKPRDRLCTLWAEYCKAGDDMPMSKAMDLLRALREIQHDDLLSEAQRVVEEALG